MTIFGSNRARSAETGHVPIYSVSVKNKVDTAVQYRGQDRQYTKVMVMTAVSYQVTTRMDDRGLQG